MKELVLPAILPASSKTHCHDVLQASEYQKIAENRKKGMTPLEGLIRMLNPQLEMAIYGLSDRKELLS